MFIPPPFREDDPKILMALIRQAGLAQFITATHDGPLATPIPIFLAADEGDRGTLYGHLARPNPQWRTPVLGDALAVFMGADAYITPSWYASKKIDGEVVPTWNYEVVQARGPVTFFDDAVGLIDVVTKITDLHEAQRAEPWHVTDAPEKYINDMLGLIVGFRMPITSLQAKRKLSQNKNLEDRAGVVEGLAASEREIDRQVSALVRECDRQP